MHRLQSQAFELEISLARVALEQREYPQCFFHLERAHILGQRHTFES
jgi:hypothetical protein